MSASQWAECVDNLTDEELAAAENAGLLAPLHERANPPTPSADQGARGTRYPYTRKGIRAELRGLSPAEIVRRHRNGGYGALLRGEVPDR